MIAKLYRFLAANVGITYLYAKVYLNIDFEIIPQSEILTEGLFLSF